MTKLTSKTRKKLPAGEFAGPNKSYPIEDAANAAAAHDFSASLSPPLA